MGKNGSGISLSEYLTEEIRKALVDIEQAQGAIEAEKEKIRKLIDLKIAMFLSENELAETGSQKLQEFADELKKELFHKYAGLFAAKEKVLEGLREDLELWKFAL